MTDYGPPAAANRVAYLGYGPMDNIHEEFDRLLARAVQAALSSYLPVLEELHAHLLMHFETENLWMIKTNFPPRDCHMNEHAAVLRSSEEVLGLARAGDFRAAPDFILELSRWFPGHADYLDSALAAWMCKRQYGGKPVVVHHAVLARKR